MDEAVNASGARRESYRRILEQVFAERYRSGDKVVAFNRAALSQAAQDLGLTAPSNIGDVIYSYRYRRDLPKAIEDTAPPGQMWEIRGRGTGQYAFVLVPELRLEPNPNLIEIKIPDATPSLLVRYALNDEQALLARLRYNRLVDIFLGVACFPLQSHLRTTVPGIGQVETDDVYLGVDRRGAHYVVPVQAKGGSDRLNRVQVLQDFAMCDAKFAEAICVPIAAQFIRDTTIVLYSFTLAEGGAIKVTAEKHYRLVNAEGLSAKELQRYAQLPD